MNYFINEAWSKAINDYLATKTHMNEVKFNSFLVVIIRLLVVIYNELDIINPSQIGSADTLKSNLSKYGYEEEKVRTFLINIQKFYDIEKENDGSLIRKMNPYFIEIQKELIDMFMLKKINYQVIDEEINSFKELLYTPDNKNDLMYSYNYINAIDVSAVDNYFKEEMIKNVSHAEDKPKNYINIQGYEALGYNYEDVNMLDGKELDDLNRKVYNFFSIRENAINKEFLLEKAIEQWFKEQNKVTSGNGFVDILLVVSVIATITMLIAVVTVTIL